MTNEEAIKKLKQAQAEYNDNYVDYCGMNEAYNLAIKALNCQESLEKKIEFLMNERPQGEWVKVKEYRMCIDMSGDIATLYKCSKCGRTITILPSKLANYPFCHCGADMRKGSVKE